MTTRRYNDDYPENETSTAQYWERKDHQMREDIAADREYAQTAAAIEDRLSVLNSALVRENVSAKSHATQVAALTVKLAEARAREQGDYEAAEAIRDTAFGAEWTREVTIERRATWNARVTSGEFTIKTGKYAGKIHAADAALAQRAQGWTVDDLKKAIARHGL